VLLHWIIRLEIGRVCARGRVCGGRVGIYIMAVRPGLLGDGYFMLLALHGAIQSHGLCSLFPNDESGGGKVGRKVCWAT
jgi:hypothetical protein